MVSVVAILRVVISHHIHSLGVFRFITHDHTGKSSRDRARRVYGTYTGSQSLGNLAYALGMGALRIIASKHGLTDAATVEHRV